MNPQYSSAFIRDLARLLEHGPGPLEALSKDLSDPSRRDAIIRLLTGLAHLATQVNYTGKKKRPGAPKIVPGGALEDVRASNPEKHEILSKLYQRLTSKDFSSDRRTLLLLCDKLGIHVSSKVSRASMVERIIRYVAELGEPRFSEVVADIERSERGSSASFEDLASFIVGRKPLVSGQGSYVRDAPSRSS